MKLPGFLTPLGLLLAAGALVARRRSSRWPAAGTSSAPARSAPPTQPGAVLGGVSSHAALGADCAACHTAPWSSQSMDDLCLACHTDDPGSNWRTPTRSARHAGSQELPRLPYRAPGPAGHP